MGLVVTAIAGSGAHVDGGRVTLVKKYRIFLYHFFNLICEKSPLFVQSPMRFTTSTLMIRSFVTWNLLGITRWSGIEILSCPDKELAWKGSQGKRGITVPGMSRRTVEGRESYKSYNSSATYPAGYKPECYSEFENQFKFQIS